VADQEVLPVQTAFDPAVHGLWKRFVDNDTHHIREGEWMRACEGDEFVGTCKYCGDYLVPQRPIRVGSRWDYEAMCRSRVTESRVDGRRVVTGCGQSIAAPGGRLAKPKPARFTRTGGA